MTIVTTWPRRVWWGMAACLLLLGLVLVPWQSGQAAPPVPTLDLALAPASAAPGTTVRLVAMLRMPTAPTTATLTIDLPTVLDAVTLAQDPGGCAPAPGAVTCTVLVGPQAPATLVIEARLAATAPAGLVSMTASAVVSGTIVPASTSLLILSTTATHAPTPTASATAVPPATPTPARAVTAVPGVPTPAPSPTPEPVPTERADEPISDAVAVLDPYENNYAMAHATVLLPSQPLTMTLVSPGGPDVADVDYVTFFVPTQRCAVLTTTALDAGVDTNIEVLDHTETVLLGNDDATATTPDSAVRWCADADTVLYARIAQSARTPRADPAQSAYGLLLTLEDLVAPTPMPPVVAPAPGASIPQPLPVPPGAPVLPSEPSASAGGNPVTTVDVTTGASAPCDPLLDGTTVVTDTAILAGTEACEDRMSIADGTIPTGVAHVATDAAALYHGPGAQYARLAVLPAGYAIRLTGATRNGWVSVALTDRTGVPPLIGWMWGPYLVVDQWDGAAAGVPTPLPAAPAGVVPTPTPRAAGSNGLLAATPGPTQGSPASALGTPLTFQVLPSRMSALTVLVCRQRAGDGRCTTGQGIAFVPLVVTAANGDVLAQGMTDASGRWIGRVARRSDAVTVGAPLLGLTSQVALTTADPVVSLMVQPAVIPPTFREEQ